MTKELELKLPTLLSFYVFTIEPNFFSQAIGLEVSMIVMKSLLKLLNVLEIVFVDHNGGGKLGTR